MPAGLRSQTPTSHTASKPYAEIVSHSADGTEARSTFLPYFWLSSESHTQVLISYKLGNRGHTDAPLGASIVSARIALILVSPNRPHTVESSSPAPGGSAVMAPLDPQLRQ